MFLILATYTVFPEAAAVGIGFANVRLQKEKEESEEMNPMKTLFFAALLLTGTTLWVRIAAQGFEQALLSAAIEWSLSGIRAWVRPFPNTAGSGR
jgi:hypothetical protein